MWRVPREFLHSWITGLLPKQDSDAVDAPGSGTVGEKRWDVFVRLYFMSPLEPSCIYFVIDITKSNVSGGFSVMCNASCADDGLILPQCVRESRGSLTCSHPSPEVLLLLLRFISQQTRAHNASWLDKIDQSRAGWIFELHHLVVFYDQSRVYKSGMDQQSYMTCMTSFTKFKSTISNFSKCSRRSCKYWWMIIMNVHGINQLYNERLMYINNILLTLQVCLCSQRGA